MTIKNIKLASSGELIDEVEFIKRLHQVNHILNSVINGNKAELFGSKKYLGWCNQKEEVVGYKLALVTLEDLYHEMKNNPVVSKIRKALTTDEVVVINQKNKPYIKFTNLNKPITINEKGRRQYVKSK